MSESVMYRQQFFDQVEKAHFKNIIWINKRTGQRMTTPYPSDPKDPNCFLVPNEKLGLSRPNTPWRYYPEEDDFGFEWGELAGMIEALVNEWNYVFV